MAFAPFAVPCFQPRITRMRRMKSHINATDAAFLPCVPWFVFFGFWLRPCRAGAICEIRGHGETTDGHRWARIGCPDIRRRRELAHETRLFTGDHHRWTGFHANCTLSHRRWCAEMSQCWRNRSGVRSTAMASAWEQWGCPPTWRSHVDGIGIQHKRSEPSIPSRGPLLNRCSNHWITPTTQLRGTSC